MRQPWDYEWDDDDLDEDVGPYHLPEDRRVERDQIWGGRREFGEELSRAEDRDIPRFDDRWGA